MTEPRKTKRTKTTQLIRYIPPIIIKLKEARLNSDIVQAELEHRIGLSEGYLSKWETCERHPNFFNLECWALSLGLRVDVVPINEMAVNDNDPPSANDNLKSSPTCEKHC